MTGNQTRGIQVYENILICLDNSEAAGRASDIAVTLAAATGARVTGCHVYAARLHNERFAQMETGLPERYQAADELERQRDVHDTLITRGLEVISDAYIATLSSKASARGVNPSGVSREGRNYAEIIAEAESGGYDLVAMGRTGLGRTSTGRLGSVAERVARRVRTDLLLATENAPPADGMIAVAIDGSPRSYAALRAAIDISGMLGGRVEAISAFDTEFHYSAFRSIAGVLTDEAASVVRFSEQERLHEEIIDSGLERIYAGYIDTAERVAASMGAEISTKLLAGKPSDVIGEYVRETQAAMLVMGRTGAHADAALDIGSVAENCMREAASADILLVAGEYAPERTQAATGPAIEWTDDAREVLSRVPGFARPMAAMMVEEAAREQGVAEITAEFMRKVRRRMGL